MCAAAHVSGRSAARLFSPARIFARVSRRYARGLSIRLAVGIARNVAREHLSRHSSRGRYNVGLCGDPDTIPADTEGPFEIIARLQQVERVAAQFQRGELSATDRDILVAVADDVPHGEIAEQLGLRPKTVRNRLCGMRHLLSLRLPDEDARAQRGPGRLHDG